MIYREEIDRLSALAVAQVILHHAEFREFSGGFVGADRSRNRRSSPRLDRGNRGDNLRHSSAVDAIHLSNRRSNLSGSRARKRFVGLACPPKTAPC
jgi:hypothetical protein